jgi:hypothetical protein
MQAVLRGRTADTFGTLLHPSENCTWGILRCRLSTAGVAGLRVTPSLRAQALGSGGRVGKRLPSRGSGHAERHTRRRLCGLQLRSKHLANNLREGWEVQARNRGACQAARSAARPA